MYLSCKTPFLKVYTFMYFNEFVLKLCPIQNLTKVMCSPPINGRTLKVHAISADWNKITSSVWLINKYWPYKHRKMSLTPKVFIGDLTYHSLTFWPNYFILFLSNLCTCSTTAFAEIKVTTTYRYLALLATYCPHSPQSGHEWGQKHFCSWKKSNDINMKFFLMRNDRYDRVWT